MIVSPPEFCCITYWKGPSAVSICSSVDSPPQYMPVNRPPEVTGSMSPPVHLNPSHHCQTPVPPALAEANMLPFSHVTGCDGPAAPPQYRQVTGLLPAENLQR